MLSVLFVAVGCLVICTHASSQTAVYRLAQVSTSQHLRGSSRTSFEGRMFRSLGSNGVALLTWQELSRISSFETLECTALISSLPSKNLSQSEEASWKMLKQRLMGIHIPFPVYFIPRDVPIFEKMLSILPPSTDMHTKGNVDLSVLMQGTYHLRVDAPEPAPHSSESSPALHMHFHGTHEANPILLVVHYDTYGAVPAVAEVDGSALAIAMNLVQQLSYLYHESAMRPRKSIHILVVGQASLGYSALNAWIEQYTLNANSNGHLYLHMSKLPQRGSPLQEFIDVLNFTATNQHLDLQIVHRKIHLAYDLRSWEHEVFSMHSQRTPALTISSASEAQAHGTLFPRSEQHGRTNDTGLEEIASVLSKAVTKFAYSMEDSDNTYELPFILKEVRINANSLHAWREHFESRRIFPMDIAAANTLLSDIEEFFFKHHGAAFELINLEITATPVVLYLPIAAEMEIQHATAPGLEIGLLLAGIIYSGGIYVIVSILLDRKTKQE